MHCLYTQLMSKPPEQSRLNPALKEIYNNEQKFAVMTVKNVNFEMQPTTQDNVSMTVRRNVSISSQEAATA